MKVLVTFGGDYKWDKAHEGLLGGWQRLIS